MLSSFLAFAKFGTGEGLLRYGICVPCKKQAPTVRDAFSEAFGVKNRLFRYGMDIRYRKPPSLVRDRQVPRKQPRDARAQFIKRRSVQGWASFFTEWVFRGVNRSCFLVLGARQWAASYPERDSMDDFCPGRILQGDLCPGEWYYRRKCGVRLAFCLNFLYLERLIQYRRITH